MHLGLITPTFLPTVGGTEVFIYEVVKRFVARGHEVTLFSRGHHPGSPVQDLPRLHLVCGRFTENQWTILPFQAWLFANLLGRRNHFDLLHQFHVFHAGGAVAVARSIVGKPLVTTLIGWDTYDELRPLPRLVYPYLAWVMNRSDAVIAISEALIPHAIAQGCRRHIEVQYLGTDLSRFGPDVDGSHRRGHLNVSDDEVLVFSLQRLDYRKKLGFLLRAIERCVRTVPQLRFVIGGQGPERPRLAELVKELGIEKHVQFVGFIPDEELASYYAACDLFALHSTYEGFGIVLADAMAAGKPVVATRVGAVPELVIEGETGRLVPPCDAKALGLALAQLGTDREARLRMGAAARRLAEKRYNWDLVAGRYLETYQALLAGR